MIDIDEFAKVLHYFNLLEEQSEYKIVCPFHQDLNPSMIVNLKGSNFYCFGCGATGDALDFVKKAYPKMDDLSAVFKYHEILKSKKSGKIKINEKALMKEGKKIDYNALDIASDFYYGLKTEDWTKIEDPTKSYMLKRGFTAKTLNKIKAKRTYSGNYPIVFPIMDNDEFRGWVCRTDKKAIEEKRKYLYNKGFSRRNTIVGKYKNTKVVIVVEGYMDRLKLLQFGMKNVIALFGWKATDEQIQKLKDAGIETIISALDNDVCGNKGTAHLKKHFKVIRFEYAGKDPGDLTQDEFDKANKKAKIAYRRMKKNG